MNRTSNVTNIALISLTRHPKKLCDESTNTDTTLSWLWRRIEPISVQASWLPLNEQKLIRTVNKKMEKTNTLALPTAFTSTFAFTVLWLLWLLYYIYFFVILGVDNARDTASSRSTDQRPLTFTFLVHASQVSITDIHKLQSWFLWERKTTLSSYGDQLTETICMYVVV